MKRVLLSIIITIIINIVLLPLYSHHLLHGVYESWRSNKTTRVDIYFYNNKTNSIDVISQNKGRKAGWVKTGSCTIIEDNLKSKWQEYKITALANEGGELRIILNGPYKTTVDNVRYPVLVDYKNLKINGKIVFKDPQELWNGKSFIHKMKVSDKEVVNISYEAKKHRLHLSDLNLYYHVNIWILLSVSALSFTLSYKVLSYAFSVNSNKNYNIINTVFLSGFFVLLFIPMSNINTAEKSEQENRMLAKKPKFFEDTGGGYNTEYGKDAEKWFNDRFFGRNLAIKLDSTIKFRVNNIYGKGDLLYLSNNNWIFNKQGLRSQVIQNKIVERELMSLYKFCKNYNIKLYFLIVPYKSSIYHENLAGFPYNFAEEEQCFARYVDGLRQKTGIPIIYPYEELRKARHDDYVFFKQSNHWTDWGAYQGYQALMKEISKDFTDIKTVSLDNYRKHASKRIRDGYARIFTSGAFTSMLGFDSNFAIKYLLKDDYLYYDYIDKNQLQVEVKKYIKNFTSSEGKYRILLTGTSQNDNLLQFLPYSAHKLKYIRLNYQQLPEMEQPKFLKYYKKEILSFKPDILIYCLAAEFSRKYILNITKE